jgi:hypothetical protein
MRLDSDLFSGIPSLYDMIFIMMSAACVDNPQNIEFLSQDIKIFSEFIDHKSCLELIVNLLKKQIVDQNKRELHNSILMFDKIYFTNKTYTELIEKLVEKVHQSKSENAFNVLRQLCSMGNNPFVRHQMLIWDLFFKYGNQNNSFMFVKFIKTNDDSLEFVVTNEENKDITVTLEDFGKNEIRKEWETIINTFKLLWDLWIGRNADTRDRIYNELFNGVELSKIFFNTALDNNLRSKILRLYINLFIDVAPHRHTHSEWAFSLQKSEKNYISLKLEKTKKAVEEGKLDEWMDYLLDHMK